MPRTRKKEPYYISHLINGIVHIHHPVFEQSFWAFGEKNALAFKKRAEQVLPKGATVDIKEFQNGKFMVFDFGSHGTIGLIWGKDFLHLVHECLHACIWMFEDRGIMVTKEQDEMLAYSQSFLLREIKRWRKL